MDKGIVGDGRWRQKTTLGLDACGMTCGCVPIGLSSVFSLGLLSVTKWYPLPEQAPVPGSSSQTVFISALLGLHSVLFTVNIIYQRYCTYSPTGKFRQTEMFKIPNP